MAFNQETLGEYIKALAILDRLSGSRVMSVMQVSSWAGLSANAK